MHPTLAIAKDPARQHVLLLGRRTASQSALLPAFPWRLVVGSDLGIVLIPRVGLLQFPRSSTSCIVSAERYAASASSTAALPSSPGMAGGVSVMIASRKSLTSF